MPGWHSEALRAIAGMFVAVFEGELGGAGFVEIAEAFGDHAIVLFVAWKILPVCGYF